MLSQDSFYKDLGPEDILLANAKTYNFDAPSAFDVPLMMRCLAELKAGRAVNIPSYDFAKHAR